MGVVEPGFQATKCCLLTAENKVVLLQQSAVEATCISGASNTVVSGQ